MLTHFHCKLAFEELNSIYFFSNPVVVFEEWVPYLIVEYHRLAFIGFKRLS